MAERLARYNANAERPASKAQRAHKENATPTPASSDDPHAKARAFGPRQRRAPTTEQAATVASGFSPRVIPSQRVRSLDDPTAPKHKRPVAASRRAECAKRDAGRDLYLDTMRAHPLGFFPIAHASRLFGITRQRLGDAVADGRVRTWTPPGSSSPLVSVVDVLCLRQVPRGPRGQHAERRLHETIAAMRADAHRYSTITTTA